MLSMRRFTKFLPKNRLLTSFPARCFGSETNDLLPYKEISFNSVEMVAEDLPVYDTSEFTAKLWQTVGALRKAGKNAIFLTISLDFAHFAPVASLVGFRYHNASGMNSTMMLWLPNTENKVPPYGTHHCGVAGAIVHENKLLVVKEHHKLSAGWKLPGGYLNAGEEISNGVQREVYEETGIKSKFSSILTFRHQHNIQFGCSDIYVICRLTPLTTKISVDHEIEDACWIDLNEIKTINKHPMIDLAIDLVQTNHPGLQESFMQSTVPGRKPFKIYHPIKER
mmetsp:Transcript_28413/g.28721  ORF Transcript_28413/g.28721 Transcript_28413/m.28721 type:complete len:281 (+) Transcript_28413:57-899(+)